jgi:hypothetical protein
MEQSSWARSAWGEPARGRAVWAWASSGAGPSAGRPCVAPWGAGPSDRSHPAVRGDASRTPGGPAVERSPLMVSMGCAGPASSFDRFGGCPCRGGSGWRSQVAPNDKQVGGPTSPAQPPRMPLGRIEFGEPIRALPTARTCETSRRRTTARGKDPDRSRANEPLRVREVAICTGQQRVARVPPADEEPPGELLAEEVGLLLDAEKGRLNRADAHQAPSMARS